MISVLVCTYNQEKYLAQAIDSILMQKCSEPFEILIGDDCSTDGTGKIADDYQFRYPDKVRVVRPEKNGGASYNIIRLVNSAKGEYLSICDGDDYWLREDVLQMQIDAFRVNPEVGMVCAKAKCYIQSKGAYEGTLGYAGAENLMTMLRDNRDVAAPTIAFRTMLMKQCIADSEWYIARNYFFDSIMAYWFAYNSRIKFINEELASYRVLEQSACHADDPMRTALYSRRYFSVKWRFLLEHPLDSAMMHELLMKEYDAARKEAGWFAESKVRGSKAYKIGKRMIESFRKMRLNGLKKLIGFE